MERSDVIMGMIRPAPGSLTATRTGAATVATASHVTHYDRATSSSPSQAALLLCTLEKHWEVFCQIHNCPWDLAGLLCHHPSSSATSTWLGCTLGLEQSPGCSPTHQSSAGILYTGTARVKDHCALSRQRQKHKPAHTEGKERTLPACVHCIYLEGKRANKQTPPPPTNNYK